MANTKKAEALLADLAEKGVTADDLLAAIQDATRINPRARNNRRDDRRREDAPATFEAYTIEVDGLGVMVEPSTRTEGNADVRFTAKPGEEMLQSLREAGFRFSWYGKNWYGPFTELPGVLCKAPAKKAPAKRARKAPAKTAPKTTARKRKA